MARSRDNSDPSPAPQPSAARHAPPQGEREGRRVLVARIGAAHGVKGEVKLWSFTVDPAALTDYGPLQSDDGTQSFEIEALRPAKEFFVARLKGVRDRTAAERLRNLDLYVPRERLPAPETSEFYHEDLIGLAVVDRDDRPLGEVIGVQNFGAGDLLEVRPPAGSNTVLVPFTEATVPVVDLTSRRLVVDPPAGLFEEDNIPPLKGEGGRSKTDRVG